MMYQSTLKQKYFNERERKSIGFLFLVVIMNKKEAIAYAQIALENMNRTNNTNLSLDDLDMNMKSAFRLYDRRLALITADAKVYAERKLKAAKAGVKDGE